MVKQPPLLLILAFVAALALLHIQAQSASDAGAVARQLAGFLVLATGSGLVFSSWKRRDPEAVEDDADPSA